MPFAKHHDKLHIHNAQGVDLEEHTMTSTMEDSATEQTTAVAAITTDPIYRGTKVILRPYTVSDAADIHKAADHPLIAKYMRNLFPNPYTLADAEGWIKIATARLPLRNFAICHASDGTYAGGIGLKPLGDVESRTMEIGYWIGVDHWGGGLTTQAVVAFTRWSFENIPELLRLEAGVFGDNNASARVLEKAGYKYEGARRKAGFKNGEAFDIRIFGMLREECPGLQDVEKTT